MDHARVTIDPPVVAKRVRAWRDQRNLSQTELAYELTGLWKELYPGQGVITVDWVRMIELGRAKSLPMSKIILLAKVLRMPVSQLLPDENEDPTDKTAAGVVLALRSYGVKPKDIDRTLAFIDQLAHDDGVASSEENETKTAPAPDRAQGPTGTKAVQDSEHNSSPD